MQNTIASQTHYHFLGIGGIGMSALARIVLSQGHRVTGIDCKDSRTIQELRQLGAHITLSECLPDEHLDVVVYSSAIRKEVLEQAKRQTHYFLHRSELLNHLLSSQRALLIAGAHGKTTTSSLLAWVLSSAGQDPSYFIGGMPLNLQGNGYLGKGKYFVAEADESDASFLNYQGEGCIVTSAEIEHLNYWKTRQTLHRGYQSFFSLVKDPSLVFWCQDDPDLEELSPKGISYGMHQQAHLRITAWQQKGMGQIFSFFFQGKHYKNITLPLLGMHQALNSAAVFGLCLQLGLQEESIRLGLSSFKGVKRRLEKKGEVEGITIFDDYAHHPTEIKVTLTALKEAVKPRRLIVLFQPHRYTRTADFWNAFAPSFQCADYVVITDIFSSGEEAIAAISSEKLAQTMLYKGCYIARQDLRKHFKQHLSSGDVVVMMGAGDIGEYGYALFKEESP